MRKLLVVFLLLTSINPAPLYATESAITTTEPAITVTPEEEAEEVIEEVTEEVTEEVVEEEEQNTIIAMLIEIYNRPEVQSSLSIISLTLVSFALKMFLNSNKNFLSKTQGLIDRGGDILTIKDQVLGTWEMIKDVAETNKHLKSKVDRIEKGEAYIGELLKGFVRSTNIKVDDKIELAKKFDEFKAFIDSEGLTDTVAYQEVKSTIDEFKEKIEETNKEDLEKVDTYLENLKAISNDNEA